MSLSDEQVLARFPKERIDQDNVGYYRGLLEGELRINRCQECGEWHMPHRAVCPRCWSEHVVATKVSGRGTVHLLIFLHVGAPVPGVDYAVGHPVATIELPEQAGLRFTTTLVNCERPEMRIGLPVELTLIVRNGQPVPAFQPVRQAG